MGLGWSHLGVQQCVAHTYSICVNCREMCQNGSAELSADGGMHHACLSLRFAQDVTSLEDLLLHLHAHGLVSTMDIMTGLATFTISLEDVRCDVCSLFFYMGLTPGSLS